MPTYRVQTILHTIDLLPANYVTNSWCVVSSFAPDPPGLDGWTAAFKDFYDDLTFLMCLPIAGTGHGIKYFDLETPLVPNYPYFEDTWDLASAPSSASLPSEVALCLSMQGPRLSGQPQARRRGRVYLGPCFAGENVNGRPAPTVRTQVCTAAETLIGNLLSSPTSAQLAIWSPTNGAATVITDGWVDNVWDTQRRRGLQTTAKTTFEV